MNSIVPDFSRMKVARYVRVSPGAEPGAEAKQAEKLGSVGRLYSDRASGTSLDRPGLQKMLDEFRGGKVRMQSADRLASRSDVFLDLANQLRIRGTALSFLWHPDADLSTLAGREQLGFLSRVAEEYSSE